MNNLIQIAEAYYTLIGKKETQEIKKYLHPNVELRSPLASLQDKEAVFTAAANFSNMIHSLTIRGKFGEGNQAMIISDSDIPGITKNFPTASLLTFQDELIIKIELFYDGGALIQKKEEVFS